MQTVGIGCELQLFPGASVAPKFNSFSLWRPGGVHTCFQFLFLSSPPTQSSTTSSCPACFVSPCRRTLLSPCSEHPTSVTALLSSTSFQQDGGPDCHFSLKTIQGDKRLPAALWMCWLVPGNQAFYDEFQS